MILHKKIPWEYEETKYEIRIYYDKNIISIIAFKENHPANGFRYHVQIPKTMAIEKILNSDIYSQLIEYSKKDIIDKRWNLSGRLFSQFS